MPINMSKQLEQCRKISRNAHCTQMRNDGVTPYLSHVEKVVRTVGKDKYLQCIAWLHDVIEDSDVVAEALISFGVDPGIVARVMVLTHEPGEYYNDYIRRIRYTSLSGCVKVKIADIVSNLSDTPTNRQVDKYNKALLILAKRDGKMTPL